VITAPPNRILHVIQDTAVDPRHRHLGSTKAIRGRTDYFVTRGIPYDELVTERSAKGILRAVRGTRLQNYAAVIFEQTLSPAAVLWVSSTVPGVTRACDDVQRGAPPPLGYHPRRRSLPRDGELLTTARGQIATGHSLRPGSRLRSHHHSVGGGALLAQDCTEEEDPLCALVPAAGLPERSAPSRNEAAPLCLPDLHDPQSAAR